MSEPLIWALILGALILILGLVEGIGEAVARSYTPDQEPEVIQGLTGKGVFLFVVCWNAPFVYFIGRLLMGWGFMPMQKVWGLLSVSAFALFVLMLGSSFSPRLQRVLFKPEANTAQTRKKLTVLTGLAFLLVIAVLAATIFMGEVPTRIQEP